MNGQKRVTMVSVVYRPSCVPCRSLTMISEAVFHREEFMAAAKSPSQRAPRRYLPPAEKRRIVELTLVEGASVVGIARESDVNPNSVHRWKALYRAGKLDASVKPRARVAGPAAASRTHRAFRHD